MGRIAKFFSKWLGKRQFAAKAKDDYQKVDNLRLRLEDPFPAEEDRLFEMLEGENTVRISTGSRIHRGDIYRFKLDDSRFQTFMVVQNDIGNKYCPSVIVVPLTDNMRTRKFFFTMLVEGNALTGLEQDYVALFFLVRTLSREHFIDTHKLGSLDYRTTLKMDEVLKLNFGLSTLQQLETRLHKKTS